MTRYLSDNCYCCGDIITHGIYFETDVSNNATNHITKTSYVGVHEAPIHQIAAPDYKTLFNIYCSYGDTDNSNLHCHVEPISPITASDIVIYINDSNLPLQTLIFDVKMDDNITVIVNQTYQYMFYLKLEGGADALVRVSDLNNIVANNNNMFVSPDTDLPIHLEALQHAPALILSQNENAFDGTEEEIQQQVDTNCVAIAAIDSNSSELAPYTVLASVDYVNSKIDSSSSSGEVVNPVQYTTKRAETLWREVQPDTNYLRVYNYKSSYTNEPNDSPIDVCVQFQKQVFRKHDYSVDAVVISFDISYQDSSDWTNKTATFNAWLSGFAELDGAPMGFIFNSPTWQFDNNNFQIHCHLDRVENTSTRAGSVSISNFVINLDQLSYNAEDAQYRFTSMCLNTPKLITNNINLVSNRTLFLNNIPFIDVVRNYSDTNQISDFFKIHNCCEIRGPNDIPNQSTFYTPSSQYGSDEPIKIINNGKHNNLVFLDELCGNPYNYYSPTSAYKYSPGDYKFDKSIIIGAKDVNLPPNSIYSSQTGDDVLYGLTMSVIPQGDNNADTYDNIDTKFTISSIVSDDRISQILPFISMTNKNIYPEEGGAYTPSLHADECVEIYGGGYNGYQQPVLGSLQLDVNNVRFSPYPDAVDSNKLHAVIDYTNKTITCDFDIITSSGPTPTPTPTPTGDYVSREEYNELLGQVNELKQIVLELNTELFNLKLKQN